MCESGWRQAEYSDPYILDFYSSLSPVCLCPDIRAARPQGTRLGEQSGAANM